MRKDKSTLSILSNMESVLESKKVFQLVEEILIRVDDA